MSSCGLMHKLAENMNCKRYIWPSDCEVDQRPSVVDIQMDLAEDHLYVELTSNDNPKAL